MELVYLWVEEYKNIKQQGFNFSPSFSCHYDKDKNELIVDEKEHIKNFFGKDINVTAIVGENGSGKSHLLELIFMPHKIRTDLPHRYILFFFQEIEGNKIFFYYASYTSDDLNIRIKNYNPLQLKDFNGNRINSKLISSVSKMYDDHYVQNKVIQTNEHYVQNMSYEASIVIKSLKLFQSNNYISLKEKNIEFQKLKITISPIRLGASIRIAIKEKYNEFIKSSIPSSNKKFDTIFKLPTLENLIKNNLIAGLLNYAPNEQIEKILEDDYLNIDLDRIISCINPEEEADISSLIALSVELLKKLNEFSFNIVSKGNKEIGYEIIFDIKSSEDILKHFITKFSVFIKRYSESYFEFQMMDIDMISDNNLSLLNLSDGERKLYSMIVDIRYEFLYEEQNYFLLLDEPDSFLHPNWTKEVISILLKNIPESVINKKIHFIITTHSPFLLSDIPKENVIFLENGKQVYPNIETFGANIHTLLSHGFFMKEGLMGEFAKSKINDVIDYLHGKDSPTKNDSEAQRIIDIIGEPVLKSTLQSMLSSKETKLEKLKRQKKELEKAIKLEEERTNSNAKN